MRPGWKSAGFTTIAVDGLAVPAGEAELLEARHRRLREGVLADMGELCRVTAILSQLIDLRRHIQRIADEYDRASCDIECADMAVRGQRRHRAALRIDGEYARLPGIVGDGVERCAVCRPGEFGGRVIESGRHIARLPALHVAKHHMRAGCRKHGTGLSEESELHAIGRNGRLLIRCRRRGIDPPNGGAAVDGNDIEAAGIAQALRRAGWARAEDHIRAVGRDDE